MAVEQTVVIIKPDAVYNGWTEEIISWYKNHGLSVQLRWKFQMSREKAYQFYIGHKDKYYFAGIVLAMSSGYCIALILKGESAIAKVRELNGATDPAEADKNSIRGHFQSAGGPFNTVHGSAKARDAKREINLIYLWAFGVPDL